MKIALHDADKTKFPNIALMKLSAWHQAQGDEVEWFRPLMDYDKVYSSKVFTFTPEDGHLPSSTIKGGTGYDMKSTLPAEVEHMAPDYSLYDITNTAYGFTTRGCIRKCDDCLVPHKEGGIRPHAEIDEFWSGQEDLILMDNNILAHRHGVRQLEEISRRRISLDCNQGMDARLVDRAMAKLLCTIRWKRMRFACDDIMDLPALTTAIRLIRAENGSKRVGRERIFVYVLVKEIEDALERVEFLRDMDVDMFCQPFRDFKTNAEPDPELKRFARWANRKEIFKTCSWEEFSTGTHKPVCECRQHPQANLFDHGRNTCTTAPTKPSQSSSPARLRSN